MWRRIAAIAGLLAVTACGGETDPVDDTESYDSTAALGRALGCEGYQGVPRADRVEFATDQGSCRAGGEEIFLIVFGSNEDRNRYVNLAQTFGNVRLLGDRWVVQGSRDTLRSLQEDVGGEIRPAQDG